MTRHDLERPIASWSTVKAGGDVAACRASLVEWFFIPLIRLRVLFLIISNCLISMTISSSDLIKFEEIFQNSPNFLWIWPLFTNIPLNSWLSFKIGEFGYYFDSWPFVFQWPYGLNLSNGAVARELRHNFDQFSQFWLGQLRFFY